MKQYVVFKGKKLGCNIELLTPFLLAVRADLGHANKTVMFKGKKVGCNI